MDFRTFLDFNTVHNFSGAADNSVVVSKYSTASYDVVPALQAGRRDLILNILRSQQNIPAPLYQGPKTISKQMNPWLNLYIFRN